MSYEGLKSWKSGTHGKKCSLKFTKLFKSRGYKRSINEMLHNFRNFLNIMQNGLGITLKSFVIFKMKVVVKEFSNYYRKIHESVLKSFVEIKL